MLFVIMIFFFSSYSDEMKNKENTVWQRKKTVMSSCGRVLWHGGSFPTWENSSVQKHRVGVPSFDLPVWAVFTDGANHQRLKERYYPNFFGKRVYKRVFLISIYVKCWYLFRFREKQKERGDIMGEKCFVTFQCVF